MPGGEGAPWCCCRGSVSFLDVTWGDVMACTACGGGDACPSGARDFTSGFHGGSCCPVICVSLFHVMVLSFRFLVLIVPFV